jgi:hypothetical protein
MVQNVSQAVHSQTVKLATTKVMLVLSVTQTLPASMEYAIIVQM